MSTVLAPPTAGVVLDAVFDRAVLDRALSRVLSVVPNRDILPVLKNVHLVVGKQAARLSGSDSVLSAVSLFPVLSAATPGEVAFRAPWLASVVRETQSETVRLKVVAKGSQIEAQVSGGATVWTFSLTSPAGFPNFQPHLQVGLTLVDREPFMQALTRVRKAVSADVMRPYLMLVDVSAGRMRASDGVRFQQVKFEFPFDCQIPARAIPELVSRLGACEHPQIGVGEMPNALLFRFGSTLFIVQKVAAKFPDVDEVLLKPAFANDQDLAVSRAELLGAVKRTRITADEDTSAVVLSLNHGSVTVQCQDRRGGSSTETIPAQWTFPPRHISFNHQHLTALLSSTPAETCQFRLGPDLKTRPSALLMEEEDGSFVAVLSQIRTDWS